MTNKKIFICSSIFIIIVLIVVTISCRYYKDKSLENNVILIKESLNRAKVNLESYRSSLDSGKLENVICELYHCRIMYPTVNKKNIIEEVDLTTLMRVISIMKSNKYDLYGLDDLDKGLNLLEKDIYSLDGFSYLEFFVNKNLH